MNLVSVEVSSAKHPCCMPLDGMQTVSLSKKLGFLVQSVAKLNLLGTVQDVCLWVYSFGVQLAGRRSPQECGCGYYYSLSLRA